MLRELIKMIAEGQAQSRAELAKRLEVSEGLVGRLLQDLTRMWALTEQGRREMPRHRMLDRQHDKCGRGGGVRGAGRGRIARVRLPGGDERLSVTDAA